MDDFEELISSQDLRNLRMKLEQTTNQLTLQINQNTSLKNIIFDLQHGSGKKVEQKTQQFQILSKETLLLAKKIILMQKEIDKLNQDNHKMAEKYLQEARYQKFKDLYEEEKQKWLEAQEKIKQLQKQIMLEKQERQSLKIVADIHASTIQTLNSTHRKKQNAFQENTANFQSIIKQLSAKIAQLETDLKNSQEKQKELVRSLRESLEVQPKTKIVSQILEQDDGCIILNVEEELKMYKKENKELSKQINQKINKIGILKKKSQALYIENEYLKENNQSLRKDQAYFKARCQDLEKINEQIQKQLDKYLINSFEKLRPSILSYFQEFKSKLQMGGTAKKQILNMLIQYKQNLFFIIDDIFQEFKNIK